MGFSKTTALLKIDIAMLFRIKDERIEGTTTDVQVVHHFRLPTAKEREAWHNAMSHIKNGKPKITLSAANQALWRDCVESVEGYDDIPSKDENGLCSDKTVLFTYFSDEIGKLHIDSAIKILLDRIGEEEVELEKK